jgi:cell division septal protein FtsQ
VDPVRRALLALVVLAIVATGVYWFALRGSSTPVAEAKKVVPVAQIGEGKTVLVVGSDGKLLGSEDGKKSQLPVLPLKARPKAGRVTGHVLEEVKVLAAAPAPLRKLVASSGYAKKKTGVEATFTSGIEVRFGDDAEAARKWKAAAAILADPSVKLLSYVDVTAPTHPATGGEAHELPSPGKG